MQTINHAQHSLSRPGRTGALRSSIRCYGDSGVASYPACGIDENIANT